MIFFLMHAPCLNTELTSFTDCTFKMCTKPLAECRYTLGCDPTSELRLENMNRLAVDRLHCGKCCLRKMMMAKTVCAIAGITLEFISGPSGTLLLVPNDLKASANETRAFKY